MLQRKCTLDFHSLPRPGADTMATEAASRVGLQTFTRGSKPGDMKARVNLPEDLTAQCRQSGHQC